MLSKNKSLKYCFLFVLLFLARSHSFGQGQLLVSVLKSNRLCKVYSFDSSTKRNGYNKIFVTYLGEIKAAKEVIKVVCWSRVWGINRHTTGIVYLYDKANKYIGNYTLGSSSDLPDKIENCNLIFTNKRKSDCDSTLITKVNFTVGMPKEIFLKCKGESGDIYPLTIIK